MCGRFSLGLPYNEIQAVEGYGIEIGEWVEQGAFQPRHNIAPRSHAPVVRRRGARDGDGQAPGGTSRAAPSTESVVRSGTGEGSVAKGATENKAECRDENGQEDDVTTDKVVLHTMKWGLVPHWSKHEDLTLNTINARAEALVDGAGMWKSLRGWRRCAVPCEGYYEWLKKDRERLPHFTKRQDGKMLLLAGLWDEVTLEGQTEPLFTFTIVTTDANKDFSWLHDRQPVMLSSTEALETWLDTENHKWDAAIVALLQPYHNEKAPLICYQVPKEVGKVGEESPTFIQPVVERKDGIQAMFARQAAKASSAPNSSQQTPSQQSSPKKLKAEPRSPSKRKRSASPVVKTGSSTKSPTSTPSKKVNAVKSEESQGKEVIDLCDDEAEAQAGREVEKINTWEDDGVDVKPGSSQPAKGEKGGDKSTVHETPVKKAKPLKPVKSPPAKKPTKASKKADPAKITAYFSKS